jgi:hypothetical protein
MTPGDAAAALAYQLDSYKVESAQTRHPISKKIFASGQVIGSINAVATTFTTKADRFSTFLHISIVLYA